MSSMLCTRIICIEASVARFKKGWDGDIYHSLSNCPHSTGVTIMTSKDLSCKCKCKMLRFIV